MPPDLTLHASCVAVGGKGLLILGPSGSGKSGLALELIARGARLVADDRVDLSVEDDTLVARCPPPLRNMIEARGVGLLRCPAVDGAAIALAVDLGIPEEARLPESHEIVLLERRVDLVHRSANAHFPAALLLYLREGRVA
jgi:HPr kinase/phosphorylase